MSCSCAGKVRQQNIDVEQTYCMQSIAVRMFQKIISSISVRKIWHHNEWFFVQYVCTEKFYQENVSGWREMPLSTHGERLDVESWTKSESGHEIANILNHSMTYFDLVTNGLYNS